MKYMSVVNFSEDVERGMSRRRFLSLLDPAKPKIASTAVQESLRDVDVEELPWPSRISINKIKDIAENNPDTIDKPVRNAIRQQVIKRTYPNIPIQAKRTAIDATMAAKKFRDWQNSLTPEEYEELITNSPVKAVGQATRAIIPDKAEVIGRGMTRQMPLNTDESYVRKGLEEGWKQQPVQDVVKRGRRWFVRGLTETIGGMLGGFSYMSDIAKFIE